METGELLGMAKQPADAAYGRAADFKSGIQQVSLLARVMATARARVTASPARACSAFSRFAS
jgi:hypothetical protein